MGCFRRGGSTYADAEKASNGAEKGSARCVCSMPIYAAIDASVVS